MNKKQFLFYMLAVRIAAIILILFGVTKFFINAYDYYTVSVKHKIDSHYTFSGIKYEDTLSDAVYQKALGEDSSQLSSKILTHQRLETQSKIIESAKSDVVKNITQAMLYLIVGTFICSAQQRWYNISRSK